MLSYTSVLGEKRVTECGNKLSFQDAARRIAARLNKRKITMIHSFHNSGMAHRVRLTALISLGIATALQAQDWPFYHGPSTDGSIPVQMGKWPAEGLQPVWKTKVSDGFSSITVKGNRAFTLELRNWDGASQETILALDLKTGQELWAKPLGSVKLGAANDQGNSGAPDNSGGDGPRSTPTADGEYVYTCSAKLVVSCFKAADGTLVWSKDVIKDFGGRNINWESAQSPLVEENLLLVAGGGDGRALIAFDKSSGEVAWKAEDDVMTHSTPVAVNIHGVRQVIFFTQKGLLSVVPKSGKVLWRYAFPYGTSTAMTPVVLGDVVFCSAGYHHTAGAVRIERKEGQFSATELWRDKGKEKINHWSSPVHKDGYVYGVFGFKAYGKAPVKCVEAATGKEVWSKDGFGPGNLILVGDKLVVLSDKGELVLVEADPKEYHELGRFQAVSGKCWSTPSLANGCLFVRSTKEAACFKLP